MWQWYMYGRSGSVCPFVLLLGNRSDYAAFATSTKFKRDPLTNGNLAAKIFVGVVSKLDWVSHHTATRNTVNEGASVTQLHSTEILEASGRRPYPEGVDG